MKKKKVIKKKAALKLPSQPVAAPPVVEEKAVADNVVSKLDDLKEQVAEENPSGSFMNPGEKKGRGRPKGSKNKKEGEEKGEGPEVVTENQAEKIQAIKGYVKPVFTMISAAGEKIAEDKRAAMGAEELNVMVDAAAHCVNQYLPEVLGAHAHLTVLSITFASWSVKVYMIRQSNLEILRRKKQVGESPVQGETPAGAQAVPFSEMGASV